MRYLSMIACAMLVLGLMGCKASNTPPDEMPGQVPPHDPDHTGRPSIHKILVTDVEKGEPTRSSQRSAPAARPEPATTETPTAEPDTATDTADDTAAPPEPDTTDGM